MEPFITANGYPALFALSFLAATLLPLGSEWLLVAFLLNRRDPAASVAVATAGNYLGACTTWLIGMYGGAWLIRRVLRIDEQAENRARRLYARYGSWSLLFSWLPVVGDPLCLIGGVLRVGFGRFSLLVAAGKLVRYSFVACLTLGSMHIMKF